MTRERADVLAEALRGRFGGEVDVEPVNGAGRYRFAVVSPRFDGVPHLRRQDEAWEVVDATLSREETLDISLILTIAPSDYPQTNLV